MSVITKVIDHLAAQFPYATDPRSDEIHPVALLLASHARLVAHIDYDRWIWTKVLESPQATTVIKDLAQAQIDLGDLLLEHLKAQD